MKVYIISMFLSCRYYVLSLGSPAFQVETLALLCSALVCNGDFELSQLSCLSSLVGRASRLECMRHGFESHLIMSVAFSLEKVLSGLVLC